MGTKLYNKMPGYIKEMENYEAFKKELKLFFYIMLFTQWRNLYLCNW
jgi:hypothetical protein